jgi:CopG family nickel-responsive transcriptional regulator
MLPLPEEGGIVAELTRFGVSLDRSVLAEFDRHLRDKRYPTRSKAIVDLIRGALVQQEWIDDKNDVAGAVTMVYDHHRRDLVNRLLDIQHDFQDSVVSTQHVHLDHTYCLEVTVVKGNPRKVRQLVDALKSEKGVKHVSLTITATGKK